MRSALLCLPLLLAACDGGDQTGQKSEKATKPSEFKKAVEAAVEQTEAEDERLLDRNRLSPALKLLPAGSTCKDVRIPRYDKHLRRTALVRADILEVVSADRFTSNNIEMRRFSKEEREVLRVRMGAADYLVGPGLLEARDGLTVSGEHLEATGAGGVFLLDSRQGFVRGPITTSFVRPPSRKEKTGEAEAEEPAPPPRSPAPAAILVPEFLEPEPLTPLQLDEIDALLASRTMSVLADRAPTTELKIRSEQLSNTAEMGLQSFTRQVDRGNLVAPVTDHEPTPPAARRELLQKREILVTCEGGMYIDGERGHLEYLRNISVVEETFAMTCSNRLLLFFETSEGAGDGEAALPNDFSDLTTIVATGGVRLERIDPKGKKPPVVASAETAIVDYRTGDFVLQGGAPTIRQGLNELRAEEPDLYLRYYANGNIFAEEGRWTTIGDLSSLKQEKDADKDKDKEEGDEGSKEEENEAANAEEDKEDKKPSEPETVAVTCTGGIYFDAKEGQLVYLGEIEIDEPRFHITCTKELKAFLRRKPEAEDEELAGLEAFSDVDWIVASGNVAMVQRDPKDDPKRPPLTARAEHVIIDARYGDIILRGGTPVIRQGANGLQAGEPDLYLRFYENGSLFAEPGVWITTGDMANLETNEGEPKAPEELITVSSRGGFFFDSLKGDIVYLEDIVVHEPRFRMNCKERLTIFLEEREAKEGERLEGPEAFSDVKGIRAEGGVRVERPDPEGKEEPIVASAQTGVYVDGVLALKDGFPTIRQGKSYARAREPDLWIQFDRNGNYSAARGKWDMEIRPGGLEQLRKSENQ